MMNPGFFKIASLCRFETDELTARDEDRVRTQEERKERVNHRAWGQEPARDSPGATAAVRPEGVPAARPQQSCLPVLG